MQALDRLMLRRFGASRSVSEHAGGLRGFQSGKKPGEVGAPSSYFDSHSMVVSR